MTSNNILEEFPKKRESEKSEIKKKTIKILIACEKSGIIRNAFTERGHDALSSDLFPSDKKGKHYQGDVQDILNCSWDMIIAHPPCTYLCNSGVRWLKNNFIRKNKMYSAHEFFMLFYNHPCKKICIENPIPHKYAELPKYDQIIQPWQFGHGETKATCLWLKGLPKLIPTNIVSGREPRIHKMPPSSNRGQLRSVTYKGIADAMAEQWGTLLDV